MIFMWNFILFLTTESSIHTAVKCVPQHRYHRSTVNVSLRLTTQCRKAKVKRMHQPLLGKVVSNMFYFPFHIWDVILPIDELKFFKMGTLHHQPALVHGWFRIFISECVLFGDSWLMTSTSWFQYVSTYVSMLRGHPIILWWWNHIFQEAISTIFPPFFLWIDRIAGHALLWKD